MEEGRLDWDDKVVDHYPDFRLGNAETTDKVLIRHLVCACTGLPRRDSEWAFEATADTPPSFVFDILAESQPTSEFGEIYQYNNLLPAAAGFIAGHILYPDMELGDAYERAMREKIFEPLGMNRTTFSYAEALSGDHARPYTLSIDGRIIPIIQTESYGFNHTVTHANPSGGAWSTPRDMLAYLDNELMAGTSRDGQRRFAEGPLLERRVAGVRDGSNSTYGMGLVTRTISGIEIVDHGGSLAGYMSQIAVVPEADTAAVILTNSDFAYPLAPFQRRLVELLYDAEPKAADQVAAAAAANEALLAKAEAEIVFPADPAIMDTIATRYESPELGAIVFRRDDTGSVMETGQWETPVATRKNPDGSVSIYPLHDANFGEWHFSLTIGKADDRRTLTWNDVQRTYVFTEVE